jgi:hypothetical protein
MSKSTIQNQLYCQMNNELHIRVMHRIPCPLRNHVWDLLRDNFWDSRQRGPGNHIWAQIRADGEGQQ